MDINEVYTKLHGGNPMNERIELAKNVVLNAMTEQSPMGPRIWHDPSLKLLVHGMVTLILYAVDSAVMNHNHAKNPLDHETGMGPAPKQ